MPSHGSTGKRLSLTARVSPWAARQTSALKRTLSKTRTGVPQCRVPISCSQARSRSCMTRYLVPLIFQAYASDLAPRVAQAAPAQVLETAAGTGVLTRALAPLLRADARYTVTDLNQPMLDRAAARQGSDQRIIWQQADALHLPFSDDSFDAVCCQFGAMFFPDRVAARQFGAHRDRLANCGPWSRRGSAGNACLGRPV